MRITDHRYNGEIERFNLAVRMIGHEARTGTIRKCTGFTEDRIRKIYGSYFKSNTPTMSSSGGAVNRPPKSVCLLIPTITNSNRRCWHACLSCAESWLSILKACRQPPAGLIKSLWDSASVRLSNVIDNCIRTLISHLKKHGGYSTH